MKTVVVLCVPRSGSSLLAGILYHLGVHMGKKEDLVKGTHVNKFGCYENQDFLALNHNILLRAGSPISLIELPKEEKLAIAVKEFETDIKRIIRKYERPSLWGWKDPSAFHTIPYIDDYLTAPHYLFLQREVDHVVNSEMRAASYSKAYPSLKHELSFYSFRKKIIFLGRMAKVFLTRGNVFAKRNILKQAVLDSYEKIENFIVGKTHLTIHFNDLINKSKQAIENIADFLDIKLTSKKYNQALNFVHPELVNF